MIPVAVSLLSRIEKAGVMRIYNASDDDGITGRERTHRNRFHSMITVIDRSIDPSIDRLKTEKVIKRYGNRHGLTLVELVALIGPTE